MKTKLILVFCMIQHLYSQAVINAEFGIAAGSTNLPTYQIGQGVTQEFEIISVEGLPTQYIFTNYNPTSGMQERGGWFSAPLYTPYIAINQCYEIHALPKMLGDQGLKIKFNFYDYPNSSPLIYFNQNTRQFSVHYTSVGVYTINPPPCRPCNVDHIISGDPSYSLWLTESSNWIYSDFTTINPTANVIFDVPKEGGEIFLEQGFEAVPSTNGSFLAVPLDGCGPRIPKPLLSLKFWLQGYFNGFDMVPSLFNQGVSNTSTQSDIVDIEFRHPMSLALVDKNSGVVQVDGTLEVEIPTLSAGNYYIVVKHRNALETWSALPIPIGSGITTYDFTTSASQAYGSNQVEVSPGVWAFYSGDLTMDENIDLLDLAILEADINNFQFGYYPTDINGDGNVDLLDAPVVEANINNFIFSAHP